MDSIKTGSQFKFTLSCPSLQLGEDVIYYSKHVEKKVECGKRQVESEAISYPEEGNEACFQIEDHSFWFRHRNDCIRELVRNFPPKETGAIFDVGGGNGFVAKGLIDAGWDVVLVEPGQSGARNAKKRGLEHVICATTHSAGFLNGSLPAIGVFDVVEHIEDDLGFLRHLWDLLEPGGLLYLTVPAYNFLWSHEDIDAGHFQRYTLGGMKKKLDSVGLAPVFGTYIFGFLPMLVFLFRTVPYKFGFVEQNKPEKIYSKDHVVQGGVSRLLLNNFLGIELRRIQKAKILPFGGSCMIAAKKK